MQALINLTAEANDPTRRGELASPRVFFGPDNRFSVAAVHTRFDAVEWFVWDHADLGRNGVPEVIRQESALARALLGLGVELPASRSQARR